MKKLTTCLALSLLATLPLKATQYIFENFDVVVNDQSALPWSASLEAQLGVFAPGFTPASANLTDWASQWVSTSSGYYDPSGPEWSVSLNLSDNTDFAVNQQLYLWLFDSQAGIGSQWSLFTDASWLVASNDGLDPTIYFLDFTDASAALFGGLDLAVNSASTSLVTGGGSAVPDAMSVGWALGASLLAMAVFGFRFVPADHRVGATRA